MRIRSAIRERRKRRRKKHDTHSFTHLDLQYGSQIIFSKENWEYIANNAPTVSGKTLSIGTTNIDICGGASGTIISTLTGKGWTVN